MTFQRQEFAIVAWLLFPFFPSSDIWYDQIDQCCRVFGGICMWYSNTLVRFQGSLWHGGGGGTWASPPHGIWKIQNYYIRKYIQKPLIKSKRFEMYWIFSDRANPRSSSGQALPSNLFEKGDRHLKFSGQPRTNLRNLMSYNGQILHDPRFFVKDWESTKVEAIRPPLNRHFLPNWHQI